MSIEILHLGRPGEVTLYCGDVRDVLAELPAESVQCVVTSPPYWGLRDYGGWKMVTAWGHMANFTKPRRHCSRWWPRLRWRAANRPGGILSPNGETWIGSLGNEPTPTMFIEHIVAVFREVRRVLRKDGTLWLNLGDGYAGNSAGGTQGQSGQRADRTFTAEGAMAKKGDGLKPKDLVGIPWRVALALQADGWYLRSAMPWVKRSAMPESCTDRPASALEYMFLMAKSARYYWDAEAVRRPHAEPWRGKGEQERNHWSVGDDNRGSEQMVREYNPAGRNFRNTDLYFQSIEPPHGMIFAVDEPVGLDVNPYAFKEAHFATYPPKLVEPCIKAGTSERGCCPECGAPWERVVERRRHGKDWNRNNREGGDRLRVGQSASDAMPDDYQPPKTLGWQPGCKCDAGEPIGCMVLDPFLGSGTTGEVAVKYGRRFVGIELNADYLKMAEDRIQRPIDDEGLIRMAEDGQ